MGKVFESMTNSRLLDHINWLNGRIYNVELNSGKGLTYINTFYYNSNQSGVLDIGIDITLYSIIHYNIFGNVTIDPGGSDNYMKIDCEAQMGDGLLYVKNDNSNQQYYTDFKCANTFFQNRVTYYYTSGRTTKFYDPLCLSHNDRGATLLVYFPNLKILAGYNNYRKIASLNITVQVYAMRY